MSTPLAKHFLPAIEPTLMAGLLYLASGLGLGVYWMLRKPGNRSGKEPSIKRRDMIWLAGAILAGGIVGPILLLFGLRESAASSASLLLNLEGVFTALLAWFVFKENFDLRIVAGMALIAGGGVILTWNGVTIGGFAPGSVTIIGACLAWAIDNNLTRNVSAGDPVQIAMLKGLLAGIVNCTLGLALGGRLPGVDTLLAIGLLGLFGYGISLCLFVVALRHLGAARTGAYFSIAPFVGALISISCFGEPASGLLLVSGVMMAIGVSLHLTEKHEHLHAHLPQEHEHLHWHDEHHRHTHEPGDAGGEPHSHRHAHEEQTHAHPHYPDIHHQHSH